MRAWQGIVATALVLGLLSGAAARAQETAASSNDETAAEQALYLEALQALAEGRKQDASRMLGTIISRQPNHAGAWLDLALIQCGLGNSDEAERLFANIETRFPMSRDLLEFIARTREAGCTRWSPASSAAIVVGRGADRNVNQGTFISTLTVDNGQLELPLLPDFLPQADQYSLVGVGYTREISPNGSIAFVQMQTRRNDRLRAYDSGSLFAGLETPYRFGKWALRTTGMAGALTLGGRLYQRQLQLQAQVTPPLPLPARTRFSLFGSLSHTNYLTLHNFNSDTVELRAQLKQRMGETALGINLGVLSDRARDQRPGGNRHGNSASVVLRRPLADKLSGELGYNRQTWQSASAYAPELLIDQVRAQRTEVLRGTLSYQLTPAHSIVLDVRAVRNRENIDIFQYNNRIVQLSWQWQGN